MAASRVRDGLRFAAVLGLVLCAPGLLVRVDLHQQVARAAIAEMCASPALAMGVAALVPELAPGAARCGEGDAGRPLRTSAAVASAPAQPRRPAPPVRDDVEFEAEPERSPQIRSDDAEAYRTVARVLAQARRAQLADAADGESERLLRTALALAPDRGDVHALLARQLLRRGAWQEGLEFAVRAAELDASLAFVLRDWAERHYLVGDLEAPALVEWVWMLSVEGEADPAARRARRLRRLQALAEDARARGDAQLVDAVESRLRGGVYAGDVLQARRAVNSSVEFVRG
jgi:hypothetical protein